MNKKLLTLIFCFILSAGLISAYSIGKCRDSDGGSDYSEKGTITDAFTGRVVAEDSCINGNYLKEYYCQSKKKYSFGYHVCNCVGGKCAALTRAYCETRSDSYSMPWHLGKCKKSACLRGEYIGCEFKYAGIFGFTKKYREICGNSLDKEHYFSSCSYNPKCNSGDKEIARSVCIGQD